ncbi:MAG: ACP S-malonyltransferase [Piscirickettsiaceae bacterium]|nr:ACP S-malonyltransferase [Piscirickettsiaceae bacterium]
MNLACVFPGQGSQYVGMLKDLASSFSQVEKIFMEASMELGYDLWQLVANGPTDVLNETEHTQPAMLAAGIAVWQCWQSETEIQPKYFAGHSLGEYTALVASGALNFRDAIKLVKKRGQFMQQAVPQGKGAMAVILGLDNDVVTELFDKVSSVDIVEAANFNSPGQVVIAGTIHAVNQTIRMAREKGARRTLLLPVSVPSHCALMRPAADDLNLALMDIEMQYPKTPVIHNTNVKISTDIDEIKSILVKHIYRPVRWVETVQWLVQQHVMAIIECGPGKVLTGLNKCIDKSLISLPVFNQATLVKAITSLGE